MRREHQAAAIRAEIERLGPRGRGRRYPETVRQRAVAYYCARSAEGAAIKDIGPELGLPWQTVHRWSMDAADVSCQPAPLADFERVEIIEAPAPTTRGALVVKGPAGLRIEGLDMDTLVELLRRLG